MKVAYDGAAFHGWQRQPSDASVEEALIKALTTMTGSHHRVMGASRTDAGVHADAQVAAFDDDGGRFTAYRFYRGLNALVPDDISIAQVEEITDAFHPRHAARGKIYRYLIWTAWHRSPRFRHTSWHIRHPLDARAMHQAAQALVGVHDFTSFRSAGCDANSPVRELYHVGVKVRAPSLLEVEVVGSAFLKHMVRNLVGTLVRVGAGREEVGWVEEVLEARDRRLAGMKAPAKGLTLHHIFYPNFPWSSDPYGQRNR